MKTSNKIIIFILISIISFFSFVLSPKADENIPISDTYFRLDLSGSQILPGFIETQYDNINDGFMGLNIYLGPGQTLKKGYVYKAVFIISTLGLRGESPGDFRIDTTYRSFGRVVGSTNYDSPITYLSSVVENLVTGTFATGYRYTILFKANADFNGISLQVLNSKASYYMKRFMYDGAAIYQVSNSDNAINEITEILSFQNQQIIEQNKETNNKLDDLNNSINSEDDDFESKKCGLTCKIKKIPTIIVDGIKNMLMGIFVPTEEQLSDILDKSQNISENFGFIGQSVDFVVNVFSSSLKVLQQNGCVTLPELTLKFGGILNMSDYTVWHEQEVCMSDNKWFGKDTRGIEVVRLITTIILLSLLINFAYEESLYLL